VHYTHVQTKLVSILYSILHAILVCTLFLYAHYTCMCLYSLKYGITFQISFKLSKRSSATLRQRLPQAGDTTLPWTPRTCSVEGWAPTTLYWRL